MLSEQFLRMDLVTLKNTTDMDSDEWLDLLLEADAEQRSVSLYRPLES